jgi:hypothetical protein
MVDCPEFSLLLSCCRWNFAGVEDERTELPAGLIWPRFIELARFHRVQGLAWNALAQSGVSLPPDAADALSANARSIAATNLAIARECAELTEAFAESGTPLLFVKGLTIAALAYRSPLLKMGWDIDVLIDPADLGRAAEVLAARGFSLTLPSSLAALDSWHSWSKESVWGRPDGLHIELHTRLADNRAMIPGIWVRSPAQQVEIAPGTKLATLAGDELFAYLCVHGASSAWFRLKWISDLAGLIAGRAGGEVDRLYDRAQQLGAGRSAGQALLLSHRLFQTPRPRLAGGTATRRLADAALKQLGQSTEPTERKLGTWRIHWTQLLLQRGLGFKAGEIARQARDAIR